MVCYTSFFLLLCFYTVFNTIVNLTCLFFGNIQVWLKKKALFFFVKMFL